MLQGPSSLPCGPEKPRKLVCREEKEQDRGNDVQRGRAEGVQLRSLRDILGILRVPLTAELL